MFVVCSGNHLYMKNDILWCGIFWERFVFVCTWCPIPYHLPNSYLPFLKGSSEQFVCMCVCEMPDSPIISPFWSIVVVNGTRKNVFIEFVICRSSNATQLSFRCFLPFLLNFFVSVWLLTILFKVISVSPLKCLFFPHLTLKCLLRRATLILIQYFIMEK